MDFDSDDVVAFNECSARQWVFEETSSIIARGGSQGGAVDEEARGEVVPFDFLPIEINDGRIIAFEAQDQAANVGDICDGEIFPIIGGNPFVRGNSSVGDDCGDTDVERRGVRKSEV